MNREIRAEISIHGNEEIAAESSLENLVIPPNYIKNARYRGGGAWGLKNHFSFPLEIDTSEKRLGFLFDILGDTQM